MSKLCSILILFVWTSSNIHLVAQAGRLESEYKLDIPADEVQALWEYIQTTYALEKFSLAEMNLSGEQSVETFIDKYFDDSSGSFAQKEVSLRYRKRFKNGLLLKELVQFKTPYSTDKVVRNEIKFEVDGSKGLGDISQRHQFLKYFRKSDLDRLRFQLAQYDLRPEDIVPSVKLKQTRQRVYIKDDSGESVATITLDEVSHFNFPFQSYAELELELNEVRYTEATEAERASMLALNNLIKSELSQKFPNLKVDQRSKYRKMRVLVDESALSFAYKNSVWFFFGLISLLATFLFIKEQVL